MEPIARSLPVGVVGAGTMGAGIAQVAAVAGHQVWLYDEDSEATDRAVAAIIDRLDQSVAKGRRTPDEATAVATRLRPADSLDDLAGCGLVIEAVVEDLAVKRSLFDRLERVCGPEAILASNTSSLSISDIAADLDQPGRVAGLHFFNPAPVLPLVEVVAGTHSDKTVVDALVATASAWGKQPVRATSTPGFIVNRVARPFYGEAFRLLSPDRLDAATIDAMMRESGGFRMGPFELADLIGHDVNVAVSRSVWEAFGRDPRFEPSPLQQRMVDEGRFGRKAGRGIYVEGEPRPEPSTAAPVTSPSTSSDTVTKPGSGVSWEIGNDDVVLRPTDGRTAAQHTGGGPRTVVLADLALDYDAATRIGIAPPDHAPAEHVEAVIGLLQHLGYDVTVLPDVPGLVVARTVAMLAAFAADAVDAGVATVTDVDTAMRLGVNYPRGPYEWGQALGWPWVAGVLDALAAAEDRLRYRVSSGLRLRAEGGATNPTGTQGPPDVELARRAAETMWADDTASRSLGMTLDDVSPGHAHVTMLVRPDMVNGHGICHGGLIFALADTAFAFACNSYNRTTVAHSCDITFVAPAHEGDLLLADARERHRSSRGGIYDVTVVRRRPGHHAERELIAEFRGRAREIPGRLVAEESP